MSIVAAIQMNSAPEVRDNLATAGRLLEEAAARGAVLAGLPENFSIMPRREADKLAVIENDGDGPIQAFLAETARRLKLWIIGGTIPLRSPVAGRPAAACLVYDSAGERRSRARKSLSLSIPAAWMMRKAKSSVAEPGAPVLMRLPFRSCIDLMPVEATVTTCMRLV